MRPDEFIALADSLRGTDRLWETAYLYEDDTWATLTYYTGSDKFTLALFRNGGPAGKGLILDVGFGKCAPGAEDSGIVRLTEDPSGVAGEILFNCYGFEERKRERSQTHRRQSMDEDDDQ